MWVSCFPGSGKEASVTSVTGKLSHSLTAPGRRSISVTSLLTRFTHTWIWYASYDHGGGGDNPGLRHVPRRPTFRRCSIRVISMAHLVCPVSDHILPKHTFLLFPTVLFSPVHPPPSPLFCPASTMHVALFVPSRLTLLTVWRLTTHIWVYRTANLQTLHFIYLFNKYRYWIF